MSGIFISYRREDSSYIAGRLHDRLADRFGTDQIFRDVDTMRPGVDFVQKIDEAVGSCDAFIVIIGAQWLGAADADGRRRLDNPRDWVRIEIAAALRRGILLVPVLVENAQMPVEAELPTSLRRLTRHHAMDLSDRRWDYEVDQLVAVLRDVVDVPAVAVAPVSPPQPRVPESTPPPPPLPVPPPPPPQRWPEPSPPPAGVPALVKIGIPVVVGLIAVAVLSWVLLRPGDQTPPSPGAAATTVLSTPSTPTTASRQTTSTTAAPPSKVFPGPFTATNGRITLTVEKVEATANRLRVFLLVKNGTSDTLGLPAGTLSVVDDTGHAYPANPFSAEWPMDLSPGQTRGVVDLTQGLQPGARTLRVGWGTVFNTFEARSGIFVQGVKVA